MLSLESPVRMEAVEVSCNLCGADEAVPWATKEGWRLVRCRRCSLIYVNPRPSAQALRALYGQTYFEDGDYAANQQRQRMYELEIAHMLPFIGTRGRFLDVGCAMGKFLSLLPSTFDKFGVEFSEDAARYARETFGLNVRVGQLSELFLEPGSYDVIQMRGVIEHLQDPACEVRTVHAALKVHGWFLLHQTPNAGGLSACVYKTQFNQVKPAEHLYYFDVHTIRRLLESLGFVIRHWWFPYWGTPYAAPWKDIPNFLLNRLRGLESPPFPGNMMALYAQKRARSA